MAENRFEFNNIASSYQNMKRILGDSSSSDSIAGILYNIDKDMKDYVDVVNMAIYGDLGKQMLLNWENTSSTFDSFINNFDNWSKAVVMASGNYTEFNEKVLSLREVNPLGMSSGGIREAYTNTGYYSSYDQTLVDTAASYIGPFIAYNGLGYFDTGSVAFEEQRKKSAAFSFFLNFAADALSIVGIGKFVKGAGGLKSIGGKFSGLFKNTIDDGVNVLSKIGDDGLIKVGQYAGQSFDTLIDGKNSQQMREITQILVDDGVIQNADDLARLFGGNVSVAKTHLTSSVYNSYIKGFKQAATAAAPAAAGTTATVSEVSKKASTSLWTTITEGTKNMGDDALAKLCGIPKQQLLDEAAMAGISTREVALEYVKSSLATSGKGVWNFAKHPIQYTKTYLETAKKGIANMSDDALAKLCGIPKQQLLDEAAIYGISTKKFAFNYVKNVVTSSSINSLKSLGNTVKLVPGAISQTTSNVGTYLAKPGTKIVLSSYVPQFIEDNILSDVAMATTSYTESVYVKGTGMEW